MISLDSYLDGITTVAISGHIRPDGDCVGSCLAVYNYICDNYPTIMADLYLEPIPEEILFCLLVFATKNIQEQSVQDGAAGL